MILSKDYFTIKSPTNTIAKGITIKRENAESRIKDALQNVKSNEKNIIFSSLRYSISNLHTHSKRNGTNHTTFFGFGDCNTAESYIP